MCTYALCMRIPVCTHVYGIIRFMLVFFFFGLVSFMFTFHNYLEIVTFVDDFTESTD